MSLARRLTAQAPPAGNLASRAVVGVGAVVLAVLLRIPLEPVLNGSNRFVLLEPAIAVAAWYGGRVSGGIATATALLATVAVYLVPHPPTPADNALALFLFTLNGTLLTILSSGLRAAYQHESRARMRAEQWASRSDQLQRLSLAFNRPLSTAQLAEIALGQATRLLGASGALVAVGRANGQPLTVLAAQGFTGGVESGMAVTSDASGPLGEVIRSGEPVILHGRVERVRRYPTLASHFHADGDSVALPLLYGEIATGAIYLNFEGPSGLGEEDRPFLRSIGAQCGSALERATLIERTTSMAAESQTRAAELNTVLQAIGDAVLVGDSDGRVILTNAATRQLLGWTPSNLSELPPRVDDAPGQIGALAGYLARSPVRSRGWLAIDRFPVVGQTLSSDVVLVRDVTRLVEADLQRDAFLGVLSHELRTPVTAILIAVDLLRHGGASGADGKSTLARQRGLLDDIDAESNRLSNIVEDLLVLTRSEKGALDIGHEPVLIQRLVKDVVDRARHEGDAEVEIVVRAPEDAPAVDAEPTYVEQIIRNLLSNALKYGSVRGRPIEVTVERLDGTVQTRVLDRGVGFAPGEADRLFTLFYRNPKAVASAPGAGIGLYVCRLLADAMRGSVWARPRPGGGAEFGFSLPVASSDDRERRRRAPVRHARARRGATAL